MTEQSMADRGLFFHSTFWTAATVIWTASVLALALSPNGGSDWMMQTFGDKLVHSAAFVVGGFLWVKTIEVTLRLSRWRTMAVGTVLALVIGIAIEVLQSYIPTRSADVRDFEADVVGVLLALGLILLVNLRRSSKS
jgi:VanZ family protein